MSEPGFVAVALKWVDLRPDVDPLAGTVRHDDRTSGFSLADAATRRARVLRRGGGRTDRLPQRQGVPYVTLGTR